MKKVLMLIVIIGVILLAGMKELEKEGLTEEQTAAIQKAVIKKQTVSNVEEEKNFIKKTYTYKKVGGHEILADVYLPKKNKIRPVIVYIHGWYMADSRHNLSKRWRPVLDKLIEADYAMVSIDFRLAPETKLEQMTEDVIDACYWVREKGPELFNADPNKLAVIGGSSGGTFALTAGFRMQPPPKLVVAVSGPGDLKWAGRSNGDKSVLKKKEKPYDIVGDTTITVGTHSDRYKLWPYLTEKGLYLWELLGFDPELEPDRFNALLPVKNITSNYPPTLLIYSEGETNCNIKKFLDAKQIKNERLVVPSGHSSQIIRGYPEAVAKIITFLDKHIKSL